MSSTVDIILGSLNSIDSDTSTITVRALLGHALSIRDSPRMPKKELSKKTFRSLVQLFGQRLVFGNDRVTVNELNTIR